MKNFSYFKHLAKTCIFRDLKFGFQSSIYIYTGCCLLEWSKTRDIAPFKVSNKAKVTKAPLAIFFHPDQG